MSRCVTRRVEGLKSIKNSDRREDEFQGNRKRVGRVPEGDSESLYFISDFFLIRCCDCRYILHEIQNKSKV
jgi:hypothetical protein